MEASYECRPAFRKAALVVGILSQVLLASVGFGRTDSDLIHADKGLRLEAEKAPRGKRHEAEGTIQVVSDSPINIPTKALAFGIYVANMLRSSELQLRRNTDQCDYHSSQDYPWGEGTVCDCTLMVRVTIRHQGGRLERRTLFARGQTDRSEEDILYTPPAPWCTRAADRARKSLQDQFAALDRTCVEKTPRCDVLLPQQADFFERRDPFEPLSKIDGGFDYDGRYAYFFDGNSYTCWDKHKDTVCPGTYPKGPIRSYWSGVTFDKIDSAVNYGNGKIYFFSGNQYIRYDIRKEAADPGYPRTIDDTTWTGLTPNRVDAAVNYNGYIYLFRGNQYSRFNPDSDRVDPGYPLPTAPNWQGVNFDRVNAVIRENGYLYFFSGNEYVRFNPDTNAVDPGYPRLTSGGWAGLPAGSALAGGSGPLNS